MTVSVASKNLPVAEPLTAFASSTTTQKFGKTGLGLAIGRKLVTRSGKQPTTSPPFTPPKFASLRGSLLPHSLTPERPGPFFS